MALSRSGSRSWTSGSGTSRRRLQTGGGAIRRGSAPPPRSRTPRCGGLCQGSGGSRRRWRTWEIGRVIELFWARAPRGYRDARGRFRASRSIWASPCPRERGGNLRRGIFVFWLSRSRSGGRRRRREVKPSRRCLFRDLRGGGSRRWLLLRSIPVWRRRRRILTVLTWYRRWSCDDVAAWKGSWCYGMGLLSVVVGLSLSTKGRLVWCDKINGAWNGFGVL